jgi:hypothetical protein
MNTGVSVDGMIKRAQNWHGRLHIPHCTTYGTDVESCRSQISAVGLGRHVETGLTGTKTGAHCATVASDTTLTQEVIHESLDRRERVASTDMAKIRAISTSP